MVRNNQIISKNHFHKDWKRWIQQNFNQVFKKNHRHQLRERRSRQLAPTPIHHLQPIVRCPTSRYNTKQRLGRGFSLAEIRSIGLNKKEARSIGIKVDHRRRNKSIESLLINKQRLQDYKSRLIILPSGEKRLLEKDPVREYVRKVNIKPIAVKTRKTKAMVITADAKKFSAFIEVRQAHGLKKKLSNRRKSLAKKQVEDIK